MTRPGFNIGNEVYGTVQKHLARLQRADGSTYTAFLALLYAKAEPGLFNRATARSRTVIVRFEEKAGNVVPPIGETFRAKLTAEAPDSFRIFGVLAGRGIYSLTDYKIGHPIPADLVRAARPRPFGIDLHIASQRFRRFAGMKDPVFVDDQIIEGSIVGNLRRELQMDEYFTFGDFLVTRVLPSRRETSVAIKIVFRDSQSDLVNPPRNSFIRAKIDSSNAFSRSPYSTTTDVVALTDIEFVQRGTGRVMKRLPSEPKFDD
jgi:hypothetical protein